MSSRTSILSHRVVKLAVPETAAPARFNPMATYSYRIVNVFTQGAAILKVQLENGSGLVLAKELVLVKG